jgi:HK97 family phage portal protein
MAIVLSQGTLTVAANTAPTQVATVSTSGPFFDGYRRSYAQIYKSQPAVRTVIDFFARNIAQLGLHGFNRLGDTERERLDPKHSLSRLIKRPNIGTTRYRFIENTVQDIGIYANGYWWKQRVNQTVTGLIRLPAGEMSVQGTLLPTGYIWTPGQGLEQKVIAPEDIVHFRMFDPTNPSIGFPPIETLRTILAEEAAAGAYRRAFWQNGARFENVITRPKDAPPWDDVDRGRFRKSWQEFAGKRAGATPILEDGMDIKAISQNFRDSEYLGSRKLTREEVAAEYHVPLPMVGILEHATFSNIKEQHKQLYQDCLGPWLTMLEEDIELQLVSEFEDLDADLFYLEFNIAEKMKGSFEEQADSILKLTGKPVMTTNEGRARLNLPRDSDPDSDRIAKTAPGQGQTFGGGAQQDTAAAAVAFRGTIEAFIPRQLARLNKHPREERAATFNHARWTRELASDLKDFTSVWGEDAHRVSSIINSETWDLLERGNEPWSSARVEALVDRYCGEPRRA